MNYSFTIKDLHLVEKEGFPADDNVYFVVWQGSEGDLDCFVGSYDVDKNQFFADYGLGGNVVKGKHVIAWKLFDDENINIRITK